MAKIPHTIPSPVIKFLRRIINGDANQTDLSLKKIERERGRVKSRLIIKNAAGYVHGVRLKRLETKSSDVIPIKNSSTNRDCGV